MGSTRLNDDTPGAPVEVQYRFAAKPFSVRGHITQVLDDLTDHLLGEDRHNTLELVLAELLNNIVEHSYGDTGRGHIVLKVTLKDDVVYIETHDSGVPMPGLLPPDPPPPNLNVPRDALPEGHFGWFMIRELCSDLQYVRTEDTNKLTLKLVR